MALNIQKSPHRVQWSINLYPTKHRTERHQLDLWWRRVAKDLRESVTKPYLTLWNLFQGRILGGKSFKNKTQKPPQSPGKIQSVLASQLRDLDWMHSRPLPALHFLYQLPYSCSHAHFRTAFTTAKCLQIEVKIKVKKTRHWHWALCHFYSNYQSYINSKGKVFLHGQPESHKEANSSLKIRISGN